jgi:LEA14-like dessication related protein
MLRVTVALFLPLLLTACAHLHVPFFHKTWQTPEIDLVKIHFEKGSLFEQHFITQVHLHNLNNTDLPIKHLQLALEVNNVPLGEGRYTKAFVLPANGDVTVPLSIRTDLLSSISTLHKIIKNKDERFEYHLQGHIDVNRWFIPDIVIDKRNTLTLPDNL